MGDHGWLAEGWYRGAGTRRSVYAAFTANLLIAISKFVSGIISGSAALLAEAAHPVADTINQVFLLISQPFLRFGHHRATFYGVSRKG